MTTPIASSELEHDDAAASSVPVTVVVVSGTVVVGVVVETVVVDVVVVSVVKRAQFGFSTQQVAGQFVWKNSLISHAGNYAIHTKQLVSAEPFVCSTLRQQT